MENATLAAKITKEQAKRPLYDIGRWGYRREDIEQLTGIPLVWTAGPNGSRGASVPLDHMRVEWAITARAKKLAGRYHRFCRYMKDTRHQWVEVEGGRTYWADNSIDITERSTLTGETRKREIMAPHGDACF